MRKLMKLIPALALVLGVTLAIGAAPKKVMAERKAKIGSSWVAIPGQVQGTHYRCLAVEDVCTQLFDGSTPVPDTEVEGQYQQITP